MAHLRSSLLEAPTEASQTLLNDLVAQSQKPSKKKHDFFIIYRETGVDGTALPDATFANDLKQILEEEKLTNGRRAVIGRANENISEDDIKNVFTNMSTSVVVLVVLSEAALKTFEGDLREPNNYLLLIQFALRLHDACGVRILGLNLVAHNIEKGVRNCVKFQGWQITFSSANHPNPWIQDHVDKSMNRLFALQGINIDLEDWEFRIPTLFASYYAAQDDLNASGWLTVLRIVPWKGILSLVFTFLLCCCFPVIGVFFVACYWKFSSKSQRHKDARLSISLFATGMGLFVLGAILLGVSVFSNIGGALCSDNQVKCEVMVRAGNRWARWRNLAERCNCYDPAINPIDFWQPVFDDTCATCVCELLKTSTPETVDEKSCVDDTALPIAVVSIIIFIIAAISLTIAIRRLQKQVMVAYKRPTIYRFKSVEELPAVV